MVNFIVTLFDKAGSKIKTLAWILFFCGIVGTIVCAFVYGRTYDQWGDPEFNFLLFIVILAGGVLASFISSLFLYAFGDITENIQRIAKATEKTAAPANAAPSKPAVFSNSNARLFNNGDTWVCEKCKTENPKSAMYCKNCREYR